MQEKEAKLWTDYTLLWPKKFALQFRASAFKVAWKIEEERMMDWQSEEFQACASKSSTTLTSPPFPQSSSSTLVIVYKVRDCEV